MLPLFGLTSVHIGALQLYWWGFFVALGIGVTLFVAERETKKQKLEFDHIMNLAMWTVVAALVGARLMHVFVYEPAYYLAHPLEIVRVWNGGMSSTGGIVLGAAVAIFYVLKKKLDIRAYGDVVARSLPAAWIIGRLGCFFTHTHPGTLSNMPFAVKYPEGGRLELSLLEAFAWAVIGTVLWLIPRPKKSGMCLAYVALLYAPLRFGLDFLRADDVRYAGLTPAQYVMIGLFAAGIFGYFRFKKYDA
jgi:phosphatidylglycerol:prolipoprotein diacylglycerol transferase